MWIGATRPAQKDDLAQAEMWRTKAMGTRKGQRGEEEPGPGGITMGDNGD